MVDYALCKQDECPKKEQCARYMASDDVWDKLQAWVLPEESPCEIFWDIRDKPPWKLKVGV